jgi:DNA-binding PadR family transcriptional regulator
MIEVFDMAGKINIQDGKIKCSCKGANLEKFIQPNILAILMKGDVHGYSIIQELESKSFFKGDTLDNAGVYRTLKNMEAKGLVRADWDVQGPRPAKKVYAITSEGKACLKNWLCTLEDYSVKMQEIIGEIKSVF